jgi:5'-nucleotidase
VNFFGCKVESDRAMEEVLGYINTSLDGRSDSVRNFETNLGNFMCDVILSAVSAECAIINGGSLRSNQIHPAGVFKRRDLRSILPFGSELSVIAMTGKKMNFSDVTNNNLINY